MVSRVVLCGVVCVFVHILLVISFFFVFYTAKSFLEL